MLILSHKQRRNVMGLDMFLTASFYISDYEFDEEGTKLAKAIKEVIGFPEIQDVRLRTIRFEVAYWRKANHIHDWFVKNVQNEEDDCGEYYVTKSDLENLKDVCNLVLADHSKAEELLPTCSGFFFGGTDYDEYYFNDIIHTVKMLEKALELLEKYRFSFYYQASW